MCTFVIAKNIDEHKNLLEISKRGGPDFTRVSHYDECTAVHNLLHLTGEMTTQPFISAGMDYFLMGEVYNWDKENCLSELHFISKLHRKYGDQFIHHIEGEFLIIIINNHAQEFQIDFYTDPWSTRQLYFSPSWCFSTLPSKNSTRLLHNRKYKWKDNELHDLGKIYEWDLNQHKDNFDDITIALENAIVSRWHEKSVLLLSGGVDSSTIAACLQDHNLPTKMIHFNFGGVEDTISLKQIVEYCNIHDFIELKIEEMPPDETLYKSVAKYVNALGNRVILSGNEVDGVCENYRNKPRVISENFEEIRNSPRTKNQFKKFPEDLTTIFPWFHFEENNVRKICDNWETSFLYHGVEGRNCFLDKRLIQEFLWLTPKLKNKRYKHFIKDYLENRNLQLPSKRVGFRAHANQFLRLEASGGVYR